MLAHMMHLILCEYNKSVQVFLSQGSMALTFGERGCITCESSDLNTGFIVTV